MNNNFLRSVAVTGMVAGLFMGAYAKPAKQGVMTVTTAEGTELRVRLAGDEFFHQYFTEDGYPLLERNGIFYYSNIDASGNVTDSGIKATDIADRSTAARQFVAAVDKSTLEANISRLADRSPRHEAMMQRRKATPLRAADGNDGPPFERGYGLFSDTHFPAYGDQKALVILVEYTDTKFNTSYDAGDYFKRMLNEDGFNDYGGTGCAAEYFRLNSGNSFRPEFDVVGPVTLPRNMAYYGGNDWFGNDQNPGDMVKDACDLVDDIVDFSQYDRDHDGIVDNVFIFYAGRGEASGGSSNTIWPHSWDMSSAGYPNLYYDGVRLHTYGCSNEWENGRPDGVGTFIHEFSHVMGLPDLYATSYTNAFTPGSWSALDYGPYNNDGMTPPLYGAFERYALGWVKPREVDSAVSATLQPISENVCGIIRTNKDTEFFLLENRQKESWDKYIPGHGMLVWHVDYSEYVWSSNTVNNSSSHQYVDILEADGTQSEYSRDGDAYPGTAHKTSLTPTTSPALKTWNNTAVNYPLTSIAESNGLITFDILGGGQQEFPSLAINETELLSPYSVRLSWTPVEGYETVLNFYEKQDETPNYVAGYQNLNLGGDSEIVIENLEPETEYFFTLSLTSGWQTSEPSEEQPAFTGRVTLNYRKVNALEAENVTSSSFDARWEEVEDATDYLVTLYSIEEADPFEDVCDFSDGVIDMQGWTSTSRQSYGMASYAGESVPSLRLADGNTLMSPVYDDGISAVTFWQRGNNTGPDAVTNVYAVTADGNQLVHTESISKMTGGKTIVVDEMPGGTTRIIIEFVRNGSNGYLALDDVKVYHGMDYQPVEVEGRVDMSSEGALSLNIDKLNGSALYAYSVRATDGELFSKPSQMIVVQTAPSSGIADANLDSGKVRICGNTVLAGKGDEILVYDCTGAVVARGLGNVAMPEGGLYIIKVSSQGYTRKHIVK